jgi:hypothetical protein
MPRKDSPNARKTIDAKPRLGRVWLPENRRSHVRGTLTLSARLSPRRNPVPQVDGLTDVRCKSVCGTRCWVTNPSTRRRCKRKACVDYRYCTQHLVDALHLYIGRRSRHLSSLSPPSAGRGLYAVASAKHMRDHGLAGGVPTVDGSTVVFEKGDILDTYGGEIMSKAEIDARYVHPDTNASYAISEGEHGVDAFCASTAGAYANDPYDPKKPNAFRAAEKAANIDIVFDGRRAFDMRATKTIHHGEEILYHYGRSYWQ